MDTCAPCSVTEKGIIHKKATQLPTMKGGAYIIRPSHQMERLQP